MQDNFALAREEKGTIESWAAMPPKLTVESSVESESEKSTQSTVHSESPGTTVESRTAGNESSSSTAESELLTQHTQNVSSHVGREYRMSEHLTMKEGEKLRGLENYYVWSLKTRSILKAERLWLITETKLTPDVFPVSIQGEQLTESQLETRKAIACRLIITSVADDLISLVADHSDPSEAWNELKAQFASGDHSQILTLMSQLSTLKMFEGDSVEAYLRRARELKSRLSNMGENVTDKQLNLVVLNGLPRSYDSIVGTLSYQDPSMTFAKLTSILLSDHFRREHRNELHGKDEALTATYHRRGSNFSAHQQRGRGYTPGRGRGGAPQRWFYPPPPWVQAQHRRGTPGRARGSNPAPHWRPSPPQFLSGPQQSSIICYSCGKNGHIARNCRHQPGSAGNEFAHSVEEYPYNPEEYAYASEVLDTYQPSYYHGQYYQAHGHNGTQPWYIDSGATSHVASDINKLDYVPNQTSFHSEVKTGGGESHPVHGIATSTLHTSTGEIKLENVRYVPSLKRNLASVGSIADCGHTVVFTNTHCWIYKNNNVIAAGYRDHSNGLYYLHELTSEASTVANILTVENVDSTELWHRRMGHLSFSGLSFLTKSKHVEGIPVIETIDRVCDCCLFGKQHRERFPKKSETRAQKPGQRIHSDLMGPFPSSLGGSRFILVFTDDYSRKSWTFFLKHKSETFRHFCYFKQKLEGETGTHLQVLRSDRGGEYLSHEFNQYCMTNGIHRELTQAKTPQQNGVSERRNRTIMERARCIAADSRLPGFLWPEAVAMATYLINRSPTRSNFGIPPEASYTGKSVDLKDLKIFGSLAFVHIPHGERKKLEYKSRKCMFVGYDLQSKAYRVYDHTRKKIIITRDVVFDEKRVGLHHLQEEPSSNIPPSRFIAPFSLADSIFRNSDSSTTNSNECEDRSPVSPVSPTNHLRAISSSSTSIMDHGTGGSPGTITPSHVSVRTETQEYGQQVEPNIEETPADNTGGMTFKNTQQDSPPAVLETFSEISNQGAPTIQENVRKVGLDRGTS